MSFLCLLAVVLLACGGDSDDHIPLPDPPLHIPLPDPPLIEEENPAVQRKPGLKRRLALFLVDFPDNQRTFPSARNIEENLEEGVVREYFNDISYKRFTYEIDSFGPFTHQNDFTSLYPYHTEKALSVSTIDVPGFDADRYDIFILVTLSDYEFESGTTIPPAYRNFRVNGEVVNSEKRVVVLPLFAGCRKRNCGGGESPEDKFREKDFFSDSPFTLFQRIFVHEFIHGLGIWGHANSRTNGSRFDYEGENLNYEYGNLYDIMGNRDYGYNLNVGYRDWLGWLKPPRKTVIEDYGCFSAVVNPINSVDDDTVAVEIVIPEKEDRYYLEVRDFTDKWDRRGHTSESRKIMAENRQGIMVNKKTAEAGIIFTATFLLDMSPSPHRSEKGYEGVPDIRDVVLKPGGEYDAPDLRLWDVMPEGGNSFSVKIMIKHPDDEPHESCAGY